MVEHDAMGKIYVESPEKTFLVLRNGKIDALMPQAKLDDVLRMLPAKGFAKVTVMLDPPKRYENYDYVLNIETDKGVGIFGAAVMTDANAKFSDGDTQFQLGGLISMDRLRFAPGIMFTNKNEPEATSHIEREQPASSLFSEQKKVDNTSGEDWMTGLRFSYDLAKQHFITWDIAYGDNRTRSKSHLNSLSRTAAGNEDAYTLDFANYNNTYQWMANIAYQYDFKKPRRTLNLAYSYKNIPKNTSGSGTASGSFGSTPLPPASKGSQDEQEQTVQLHYYDPISSIFTLQAGTGYIYRDYTTESHYYDMANKDVELPEQYGFTDSRKHIVNGYATLSYSKRRFNVNLSLKADYLNDGDGTYMHTGNKTEQISETGLTYSPGISAAILFPKSKFSRLSLSYERRMLRPRISQLSPYIDYSNPNYIRTGNPNLKPEILHSWNVSTSLFRIYLGLTLLHSNNQISSYYYQNEDMQTVQSYANYARRSYIGGNVSYSYSKKNISANVRLMGGYNSRESAKGETNENININPSISIGYTFKFKLRVGADASYHYTHTSGLYDTKLQNPFSFRISGQKQWFKDDRLSLEASLSLTNFSTGSISTVNTADFMLRQEVHKYCLPLTISLSYNIGTFNVKPLRQVRKGAVINDLKTE